MSLLLCFLLFFFSAIKSFPCHVTSLLRFNSAMTVCEFLVSGSLPTLLFVRLPCKDSVIPAVAKRLEDKSMLFTQFVFYGLYQLEVLIFFSLTSFHSDEPNLVSYMSAVCSAQQNQAYQILWPSCCFSTCVCKIRLPL